MVEEPVQGEDREDRGGEGQQRHDADRDQPEIERRPLESAGRNAAAVRGEGLEEPVLQRNREAEGNEQRWQDVLAQHTVQDEALQQPAEREHQWRGKQRGDPGRQTEPRDANQHQIGGEDDEVAVSEIDEPHDAEDEAQPRSKQGIEPAQQDSLNEGVQPDHRRAPSTMRGRGCGSGRRRTGASVMPPLRNKRRGSAGV